MTYREKTITVSLMTTLLIFGFYTVKIYQIYQRESINPIDVFSLWATVIIMTILVNIVANILTNIVTAIIHHIRTNEEESYIEDERDEMIGLKGTRNAYYVFSLGVLISMIALVMDKSPLLMFNLLVFTAITAEIVGDVSRLYIYRRGF